MNSDLSSFFAELTPEVRCVVLALRDLVQRTVPQAEETLLWGGLSYHLPATGGRVKGAVCMIAVKGDEVRLDFIHGVRLVDPSGILQGTQLSKRCVPVRTVADTDRPEIADLIRAAAALDPTQWIEPIAAPGRRRSAVRTRARRQRHRGD